jgi:serine/threonine protein kinase
MITGRRAFEGDSQASVLASIIKDQPPPLSERQPGVPRAIARVVRKCLEKKPDDRWQSARDLKAGLELIDLEAPASSGSGSGIPAQALSRRRWLWPAVAAAAILIVAGVGSKSYQAISIFEFLRTAPSWRLRLPARRVASGSATWSRSKHAYYRALAGPWPRSGLLIISPWRLAAVAG